MGSWFLLAPFFYILSWYRKWDLEKMNVSFFFRFRSRNEELSEIWWWVCGCFTRVPVIFVVVVVVYHSSSMRGYNRKMKFANNLLSYLLSPILLQFPPSCPSHPLQFHLSLALTQDLCKSKRKTVCIPLFLSSSIFDDWVERRVRGMRGMGGGGEGGYRGISGVGGEIWGFGGERGGREGDGEMMGGRSNEVLFSPFF